MANAAPVVHVKLTHHNLPSQPIEGISFEITYGGRTVTGTIDGIPAAPQEARAQIAQAELLLLSKALAEATLSAEGPQLAVS
jgi:hypothetical protein